MNTNTTSSSDLSRGPFSATKLVSISCDGDFLLPWVDIYKFFFLYVAFKFDTDYSKVNGKRNSGGLII